VKGEIDIGEILNILKIGDKRFNINCPGRCFEMETKSSEECTEWVGALNLLIEEVARMFKNLSRSHSVF
jgi:hypothetical protein